MGARVNRWREEGLWPVAPQVIEDGDRYAARFDDLFDLAARQSRQATPLLEAFLIDLQEQRGDKRVSTAWLAQVLKALSANADVTKLAEQFGLSESAIRRRFKPESGGTALHEYVVLGRLGQAKNLLEDTNLSLARIAEVCGYSSEAFFSRQFKQHTGMSPGAYRSTL
jgi:AraC-like DNA-binding protein